LNPKQKNRFVIDPLWPDPAVVEQEGAHPLCLPKVMRALKPLGEPGVKCIMQVPSDLIGMHGQQASREDRSHDFCNNNVPQRVVQNVKQSAKPRHLRKIDVETGSIGCRHRRFTQQHA
jgi:hypothetical protein